MYYDESTANFCTTLYLGTVQVVKQQGARNLNLLLIFDFFNLKFDK